MSASPRPLSDAESPVQLVVLVHGLLGTSGHLQYLQDAIASRACPRALVVREAPTALILRSRGSLDTARPLIVAPSQLNPSCNALERSFDGIDKGGERLYSEIRTAIILNPTIEEFSILGYSLGGLYARYAVGRMFEEGWFNIVHPRARASFGWPPKRIPLTPYRRSIS
eukprot:tig00020934_g16104.t1